jgi:hypothetical protein
VINTTNVPSDIEKSTIERDDIQAVNKKYELNDIHI